LTPYNCVVAIIDLQPQMLFGVANFDRQTIINNNVALLKAAKVFNAPVVLSTVETKSFGGNMWPQIQAVSPNQTPIERSSMNSWNDKNFVAAIEKSGKKKIVLAGLWTETCVALPTVQVIHDGYEIYVVEYCCGDVSQLSHDNAMKRVIQAGAKPVTALSVMLEWQREWAERDTYDALMDIVKTHCGAYGIGVEYAYTMVHGAPATKYPEYVVPASGVAATERARRHQPRVFPQLHKDLFAVHFVLGEDLEDPAVIDRHASAAGIDLAALHAALADDSASAAVREAEMSGRKYGVHGTPAWLLAQRLIEGLRPAAEFEPLAEHAIQLAR
jgi:nicotinamidase-related amidase